MMRRILVYTFFAYGKVTSRLLYSLRSESISFDTLFISSSFATKKLISLVSSYDCIIGIADHNKNAILSRYDPLYCNRYCNRVIDTLSPDNYCSTLHIPLSDRFYTFKSVTNGPCNRSAFLVMKEITEKNIQVKYGFFHLCKAKARQDLEEIIQTINLQEAV